MKHLQFSVGCSTRSTTSTSIGPFCDPDFSPSCSCTAVKIEGPFGSIGGSGAAPGGGGPGGAPPRVASRMGRTSKNERVTRPNG